MSVWTAAGIFAGEYALGLALLAGLLQLSGWQDRRRARNLASRDARFVS